MIFFGFSIFFHKTMSIQQNSKEQSKTTLYDSQKPNKCNQKQKFTVFIFHFSIFFFKCRYNIIIFINFCVCFLVCVFGCITSVPCWNCHFKFTVIYFGCTWITSRVCLFCFKKIKLTNKDTHTHTHTQL